MGGLFSSPQVQQAPAVTEVQVPVVNQEQVDRDTADIMRKRKGSAATVLTTPDSGTTAGAVAGKTLLGQ
jgi:hypothetical protein